MNIIQILPNLGLVGGTAAKVKILAEFSKHKHIIFYGSNPKNGLYIEEWKKISGIKLEEGFLLRNPIKNALLLRNLCKKYNCNIIQTYFPIDSVSAAIAKILYPSIKIVRSFEGIIHYSLLKTILQRVSFITHSRFISISKYVENYYVNCFEQIRNKIETIYLCPAIKSSESLCRHEVNNSFLLSIGGLNPSKNTETLVETINILKHRGVNVKYHVLGDGPLRNKVEQYITTHNLSENVFLHGFRHDVTSFLDHCSIYVHPANCEGFGMAVVEAMSRKCAIMVSDSCALPELVEDGVSGYVLPTYDSTAWANKIQYLLNRQNVVDSLGEEAYKRYQKNFSIDAYVENMDKLYADLI